VKLTGVLDGLHEDLVPRMTWLIFPDQVDKALQRSNG
jgi:hypothetical protein